MRQLLRLYRYAEAHGWPVKFYPGEGPECAFAPMLWVRLRDEWWVLSFRDWRPWRWGTFRIAA